MLYKILINDIVLIKKLEIEFKPGLSVLDKQMEFRVSSNWNMELCKIRYIAQD